MISTRDIELNEIEIMVDSPLLYSSSRESLHSLATVSRERTLSLRIEFGELFSETVSRTLLGPTKHPCWVIGAHNRS